MQTSNKKSIIYLTIFYIVVIALIAGAYFIFTTSFFNSFGINYAKQNQELYSTNLSKLIEEEQTYFINDDLDNSSVIDVGTINNNTISYLEVSVDLENNYLNNYNIAMKDNYLFLINNNTFGVLVVEDLIDKIILSTKAKTIMIMDNTGNIHYNSNNSATNISLYIDSNTTKYINDYFSLNKSGTINDTSNKEEIILSFHPLTNYNNIYLMESFLKSDIAPMYFQYDLMFIIGLVIFTLVIISIQIYIFRSIHIKNAEIEAKKIKFLYSKPYIIRVNFKGQIKKLNRQIQNEVYNINQYSNLSELKIVDYDEQTTAIDLISRERPFTVKFADKSIRFIPVKYSYGYHLVGEDVTTLEQDIEEMRILAFYDSVTLQPNYSYFKNDLTKYIVSNEFDYKKTSAVIFDVSSFNFMNKVFGKKTSDIVLFRVGELLKKAALKLKATVYNTEEDRFVVLFKNNQQEVEPFVKDIFNKIEKPLEIEHNNIKVELNGGIYYFDIADGAIDAPSKIYESLMVALSKSKESSIQSYVIYDEAMKITVSKRNTMTKDLIKAIEEEEITVYLQPQYNNHTERIDGFEALVRWDNPKYINSSPQEFIEIAEHNNLIIPIGQLIMKQTFVLAQKLKDYKITISMNVSPVQLLQDGFVDDFLKQYEAHKLPKGSIAIEVTETFLITSLRVVNEKLKILKANGISIHLDDFGTGYSSLPYLRELAIDTVKIDRTFIRYLETDKKDREIVKMLLSLINSLDLDVIGEGIEDEYQNNYLYKNGCNVVQGFILSPAVPFDKALLLLKEYNIDKTKTLKVKRRKRGKL